MAVPLLFSFSPHLRETSCRVCQRYVKGHEDRPTQVPARSPIWRGLLVADAGLKPAYLEAVLRPSVRKLWAESALAYLSVPAKTCHASADLAVRLNVM